jgi:DNA-binding transcriptional LysR family regulator
MELRHLRYFLMVARLQNFTQAAQALHIAQPSLSQQIRLLEKELGVTLFARTYHAVHLTEAGMTFHSYAERMVDLAEESRQAMIGYNQEQHGTVTIGTLTAFPFIALPSILKAFRQQHPAIRVLMREESIPGLAALLRKGEIDCALICVINDLQPPELASPQFATRTILREELAVVASASSPFVDGSIPSAADLHQHPFVAMRPGSGLRQALTLLGKQARFLPTVTYESSDITTIVALTAQGLGLSILPCSVVQAHWAELQVVPRVSPALTRCVQLIALQNRVRLPSAQAWISFFTDATRSLAVGGQ